MALSIGVKRGSLVNIGGLRVGGHLVAGRDGRPDKLVDYTLEGGDVLEVTDVLADDQIEVEYLGKLFLVTDKERTKLAEDVFVSCGLWNGKGEPDYGRLAFEAPRSIRIERIPTR